VLQEGANNLYPVPKGVARQKLTWMAYLKAAQRKLEKPRPALTRLATATWGFSLVRAREIYTKVICSAIAYIGKSVW
jgi:hypothetical protein